MPQSQATFALLQPPSFDVLPDTDVVLGTVHPRTKTKPRRPDTKRVLNRQSRVTVPAALYRTRTDPSVILDGEKLKSGGSEVKVHLPFIQGVGGDVGAQLAREEILYIDAKNVETQWFLPDDAYFLETLKGVTVEKELLGFRTPSVFLVTGVKIAESATIVTGHRRSDEGNLGPEVDLSPFNIPIQLAAKINGKRSEYQIVPIEKKRFVLAFETRRIRVKRDSYEEEDNNDLALLDDEINADALSAETLRERFNLDENTTEIEDDE